MTRLISWVQRTAWLIPEPRPTLRIYRDSVTRTGRPIHSWVDAVLLRELQTCRTPEHREAA